MSTRKPHSLLPGLDLRFARWSRFGLLVGCLLVSQAALATTTINVQFSPATIDPGDASRYTITLANTSLVALTAAQVTVLLPSQITIASPANASGNCGFASVSATPGSSAVVLAGGTVPAHVGVADGQCTFQVDVTATAPGNWVATIPANTTPSAGVAGYSAIENGVPVWNGTPANATLFVATLQPPTGSKTFTPSTAVAGDPVTLTIALTNPNAGSTMPLTSFTDTLPGNMVVAGTPGASVSCTGTGAVNGSVAALAGGTSIVHTGGTIGRAGSCTITVNVTVPTISGTSQAFANDLASGAIGNARGLVSPPFSRNVTVNSPIGVSKSFNPTTIPAGQPSLLTILVANGSTASALPISSFADDLTAANLTVLTTASAPTPAPADPVVDCTGVGAANGTLTAVAGSSSIGLAGAIAGPGGRCRIRVYVTTSIDGPHVNTIAADAVANPAGHQSPAASATLTALAQLTIASKSAVPANVAPGQSTTFTVVVNNWSGGAVTGVNFKDLLPSTGGQQMTLTDAGTPTLSAGCAGGSWFGTDAGGASTGLAPAVGDAGILWSGGTIAGGSGATPGICQIQFRASLPPAAPTGLTFANTIPIGSVTGNGPGGGVQNTNAGSANVASISSGDVSKAFSPSTIAQGGTSTLTVTLYNRTQTPLTGVALTDVLPAGLTLAANPAPTNSCGGTLQAFPLGGQVVLTGGVIAARPGSSEESTCAFSAKVTGTALGGHVNQIDPGALATTEGITNPVARTATLTISTGLGAVKSFTPTAVTAGGRSRVRIAVTNGSTGQLTNVQVNDTVFSAGLTVANPANAATTCAGAPTVVANPGATQAQLVGATLAAGGTCDFSFDVTTAGSGPWSNTIPIGGISSAQGPANTSAVSATLAAATAAIGINKSFNPVIVTGGVPSTLTIDVINSSPIAITGASFTDVFPPGIVVFPVPNASTTCAGGSVTALPNDGKVALAGATLAPTSTCQVTISVTSTKFLNLTNAIPAGAILSDQGYTNATGTEASLSTLQGLGVAKEFAPAHVTAGQTARIRLHLTSTFDANALTPTILTGVSFTDSLPAGIVFASPANATTDCSGGVVTPNSGTQALTLAQATIHPGTACVVEADVTAASVGAYTNSIPAFTVTTDQGITNQEPANATLHVVVPPSIAKAFGSTPVRIGQASTLTVTVTNNAAVALTGLAVTDALPAGMAIAGTPAAATTCSGGVVAAAAAANSFSLAGATVPANGSCLFRANVVASTAGALENVIVAGAIVTGQGLTNPLPGTATLDVLLPPTVTKAFAPASIAIDGTSTLTITLGNANAADIALTSALVDALPGNVVVATTPNVVKTCPGAVTAGAGAATITYASGATIPAGGCTIAVAVTSGVAGGYVDVIAAGQLQTTAGNNGAPAVATLGVDQAAAPSITKSFAPKSIAVGGISTLTIAVVNPNAAPLTLSAALDDTLPPNVHVATVPNVGGTCGAANVTAVAGSGLVRLADATSVAPGGCTITVDVTSDVAGGHTNVIAAGALATSAGTNPQPAIDDLVVRAAVPPTVQKAFSGGTINPGASSRLTIALGNANPGALTLSSALVDTLPPNVTVAATPNVGGTCMLASLSAPALGSAITYAAGATIPPGGCTIQVDVTSTVPGGPWVNTIAVGALATDGGSNGAPAVAQLLVNPLQPPSVSKSFAPTVIGAGGVSTLTISLGNGNATAAALTADLVDTLPANLRIATPPAIVAGPGCTPGKVVAVANGTSVTYQAGGAIPANGGCTFAVNVTSSVVATYANTIAVGALRTSIGNNSVATSAALQVLALPSIAKAFVPTTILTGGTSTLTLTLSNANAAGVTLTAPLVDSLPTGMLVASPATIGGTCTLSSVLAPAGGSAITYQSGAAIPAGGCNIVVPVAGDVAGVFTNTIPVGALTTTGGANPGPATAVLTVLGAPTVAKSFSPAAVLLGARSTLTISLANANAVAAVLAADLVDPLPAGLAVDLATPTTGTCDLARVLATTGSVTYGSGATIPSGGCTIRVAVVVTTPGDHVNTIAAGALVTDAGTNAGPATATVAGLIPAAAVPAPGIPVLAVLSALLLALGWRVIRRRA